MPRRNLWTEGELIVLKSRSHLIENRDVEALKKALPARSFENARTKARNKGWIKDIYSHSFEGGCDFAYDPLEYDFEEVNI